MKDRIKYLRDYLTLTQQKFADRLGLKRQTIAAYEMGKIEPSDSTLLLICKEFNVNEKWMRDGVGPIMHKVPNVGKLASYLADIATGDDDLIQDLVMVYMELDPSDREVLKKIRDKLIEKAKDRGQD